MVEHPVQQPIRAIDVAPVNEHAFTSEVGKNGVTRIEACTKPGLHCDIPYVRVWAGEVCLSEFCQHNIVGVFFAEAEESQ